MDKQILDTLISIKNVLERSSRTTAPQSPHAQNDHTRQSARPARSPAPSQKSQAKQDLNTKGTVTAMATLADGSLFAARSIRVLGRKSRDTSDFVHTLGATASIAAGAIADANVSMHSRLKDGASSLDSAIGVSIASVIDASSKLSSISTAELQTKVSEAAKMLETLSAAGSDTTSFDSVRSSLSKLIGNVDHATDRINELSVITELTAIALDKVPLIVTRIQGAAGTLGTTVEWISGKMTRTTKAFSGAMGGTIDAVNSVNAALGTTKTVLDSINSSGPPPPPPRPPRPSPDSGGGRGRSDNTESYFRDFSHHLQQNSISLQATINRTLIRQASMLGQHFKSLGDDIFTSLMPRGFDLTGVISLSTDALKAGMSLREYTKMVEDSSGVVSRVGGLDNFNKVLTESNKQLAHLGVFGEDASRLSQSIATTSQSMGVPVDQIGEAVAGQVKVFDKLRKTTNMSSASFEDLRRTVIDSEITQSELLALAPAERAARQTELIDMASWGAALGMSKNQTAQLAQAMMDLRKSTVKQRNEDAMHLTQAFAMVGMSASQAAEAAALKRKSKPNEEESKRLTELMGLYKQKADQITGSNDAALMGLQIGVENVQEKFSGSLQKLMDSGGQVIAQQESGAQTETDKSKENKQAGLFSSILTPIEGFLKSDMAKIAVGVGAFGLNLIVEKAQLAILKSIDKKVGGDSGGSDSGDTGGSGKDKGPRWKRKLRVATRRISRSASSFADTAMDVGRSAIDKIKNPVSTAKSVVSAVKGFSPSAFFKSAGEVGKNVLGKGLTVVKSGFEWLGKVAGPVIKKLPLIGTLLTTGLAAFDYSNAEEQAKEQGISTEERKGQIAGGAIGSVALGALGAAFGGPIGAMVGGVVGEWLGSKAGGLIGANFDEWFGPSSWIGKAIASVSSFVASAGNMVSSAASKVAELGASVGNAVSTWAAPFMDAVNGWFKAAQDVISTKFEEWFGKDTKIGAIISGVSSIASSIANTASDIFSNFASWFGKDSTLARVVKGAAGVASSAIDATSAGVSAAVGSVKSAFKSNTDATVKNTSAVARSAEVAGNDLGSLASDVRSTAQAYARPSPTKDSAPGISALSAPSVQGPSVSSTPVTQVVPTPQPVTPVAPIVQAIPSVPTPKSVNQQAVNTTTPTPLEDKPKSEVPSDRTSKPADADISSLKDGLQLIAELLKKANETELAQLEALLAMIRSSGKSLALLNNQDLTKMLNA